VREKLTIAAIRSGTEPLGKLPEAAFHRTLETPLGCPRCDATYNLIVGWEQASSRWFEQESRALIRMLKKTIQMEHCTGHRVSHFETSGVVVKSFTVRQD
jgi:hypothetical protein